jgi:hypothetical protein
MQTAPDNECDPADQDSGPSFPDKRVADRHLTDSGMVRKLIAMRLYAPIQQRRTWTGRDTAARHGACRLEAARAGVP